MMHDLFFMDKVLAMLSNGSFFRRACGIALRVTAVLLAIFGLVTIVTILQTATRLSGAAILGGLLFSAVVVVGYYMIVHAMWLRSGEVEALPDGPFTVVPIAAVLLRLGAEVFATNVLATTLGAGLFLWFAGNMAYGFRESLPLLTVVPFLQYGSSSFVAGLTVMIAGAVTAFLTIVVGYLLAEMVGVLTDIAVSARHLRAASASTAVPSTPPTGASGPVGSPAAPTATICTACGAPLKPGDRFCERCGQPAPVTI